MVVSEFLGLPKSVLSSKHFHSILCVHTWAQSRRRLGKNANEHLKKGPGHQGRASSWELLYDLGICSGLEFMLGREEKVGCFSELGCGDHKDKFFE